MHPVGRRVLATVAGLLVGMVVIGAVERIGHLVYPPPPGIDLHDRAALEKLIAEAPAGALLFVACAWLCGTLAGTALARTIEGPGRTIAAVLVGVLLLLAGIANLLMLPHPAWFVAVGLAALVAGGLGGTLVAGRFVARRAGN